MKHSFRNLDTYLEGKKKTLYLVKIKNREDGRILSEWFEKHLPGVLIGRIIPTRESSGLLFPRAIAYIAEFDDLSLETFHLHWKNRNNDFITVCVI